MDKKEKHVLKFKGPIKGRVVVSHDKINQGRKESLPWLLQTGSIIPRVFSHRFRMGSSFFQRIVDGVKNFDPYLTLRKD